MAQSHGVPVFYIPGTVTSSKSHVPLYLVSGGGGGLEGAMFRLVLSSLIRGRGRAPSWAQQVRVGEGVWWAQ